MKERPILFSAPMVRALLAGSKTQTRRIVKDKHIDAAPPVCFFQWLRENCPYGQTGDRLWVRETWIPRAAESAALYRADYDDAQASGLAGMYSDRGWRPSIHMPRWASRILLEITGVRVERLQDISDHDALAEGVSPDMGLRWQSGDDTPRGMYGELWESINGPGSWAADPWVWVVEFKRVTP
jgi:hypothetical protein